MSDGCKKRSVEEFDQEFFFIVLNATAATSTPTTPLVTAT